MVGLLSLGLFDTKIPGPLLTLAYLRQKVQSDYYHWNYLTRRFPVNIGIFEPKRSVGLLSLVLFDTEIPSVNLGIFEPKRSVGLYLTWRFPLLT